MNVKVSPSRSTAGDDLVTFRGGERVKHPKFGTGTVVGLSGEGARTEITVVFEGAGATTIITLEAGRSEGNTVSEEKELVQSIYELQIDRDIHECRHEQVGCP